MSQGAAGSETLPAAGTIAVTTTAVALPPGDCSEVLVQNDPGSASNLLVGNAAAQVIALTPLSSIPVQVVRSEQVYVRVASGSATANWLVRS